MRVITNRQFGSSLEAILYPVMLLAVLWSIYLVESFHAEGFVRLGILPKTVEGIKGIFFSPLIHAPRDISHILNNSLPAAVLFGSLVYFYRRIAFQIFFLSWIISGILVWIFAQNDGHYHIGFSGVIYALAGFLFTSGGIRKYRPLQAISLFVLFVYGSMVWGIFPMKEGVSWEGHLTGLCTGVALAYLYRKKGPQAPKYQYEIERDLGIEPPDFEGIWKEQLRIAREREEVEKQENSPHRIIYHYRPEKPVEATPPGDKTDES
ncbi:MAG: rhomboid family intramembrane serine protease [Bacteroidetes bacterium]|nr:MAG: rhomboid family intramembrane serine protease [Bacteroidota bacterium]